MEKEKLQQLIELSDLLANSKNLNKALPIASQKIKDIIDVDRVTVFIYSPENNILWTYLADGIDKLILPADKGIVGYVVEHKTIKKVNDTSKEPLFYKEVDEITGYQTKSILTLPLLGVNGDVIGVIQLLNKKDGKFNVKDINIANLFSNYVAPPLEMFLKKNPELRNSK